DILVVAGLLIRRAVFHCTCEFFQCRVVKGQRPEVRKHFSEHARVVMPLEAVEKFTCGMPAGSAMTGQDANVAAHAGAPSMGCRWNSRRRTPRHASPPARTSTFNLQILTKLLRSYGQLSAFGKRSDRSCPCG